MPRPLELGEVLVAQRRAQGVSQQALAASLGVTQPQIARWEASRYRSASLANVDAVACALGIDVGTQAMAAEAPAVYSADTSDSALLARLGVELPVLSAFCRSHGVRELAVFGSAARGSGFRPGSDVDLLVTWQDGRSPSSFGELADVELELSGLFRRRVDLLERGTVERSDNYVRRAEILNGARTVYAA